MMAGPLGAPLWAVHIADGVLANPWLLGGFLLAAGLALLGSRRLREEEIPRVALLSAVFFVASTLHVRVGPTSVHLLLNGLVGAVLGWRAALAIPIGLFLQAALIGHGAYSTLGVNSCVLVLPALAGAVLFDQLRLVAWSRRPILRAGVVGFCALAWLLSLVYGAALLFTTPITSLDSLDLTAANEIITHPITLAAVLALTAVAVWAERRLGHPAEFPLGLLLGETTVVLTLLLNSLVLVWGGAADWHTLAFLVFLAHLPVAVIEGAVLGFTVSFLARVQPHLFEQEGSEPRPLPDGRGSDDALPASRPALLNGVPHRRAETPLPAALPTAPAPR